MPARVAAELPGVDGMRRPSGGEMLPARSPVSSDSEQTLRESDRLLLKRFAPASNGIGIAAAIV